MLDLRKNRRALATAAVILLVLAAGLILLSSVRRAMYPREYNDLVERYCAQFEVEESLAYAVIRTESGFDPSASSSLGARGLMQIMPDTFAWLQTKLPDTQYLDESLLYDPEINIRYGVFFLSILQQEFGDDRLAVAAYHAGRGQVNRWIRDYGIAPGDWALEDIPSDVTGHYVGKVERARDVYVSLYY